MALLTNSYGDTDEVAALVPRRAGTAGVFDEATRPSLPQLESLMDQVSAAVNSLLSHYGFDIPVTQADAKLLFDLFVNEEAAAIVEGINGSGRFGPTSKQAGSKGRWAVIFEDVQTFIEMHAVGIERLGVTRSYDPIAGISFRGQDEGGDDTFPIFQRDGYGNRFTDWDQ